MPLDVGTDPGPGPADRGLELVRRCFDAGDRVVVWWRIGSTRPDPVVVNVARGLPDGVLPDDVRTFPLRGNGDWRVSESHLSFHSTVPAGGEEAGGFCIVGARSPLGTPGPAVGVVRRGRVRRPDPPRNPRDGAVRR